MSKNTAQVYGAVGKTDLLQFDPATLKIVTDKKHELYDERTQLPLDEALVLNIMTFGVLEPVIVRRNPETGDVEVVDGRQRTRACVEANKRLLARGEEPYRIAAVTKRGEPHVLMGMLITTNEHRQDDSPITKAKKAQRYLDRGRTLEELTVIFGKSTQTIKSWLALLDAPADVQDAVAKNDIPASAVKELAALPAEKRTAAIKKKAATKGKRTKKTAPEKVQGGGGGKREAKKLIDMLKKSNAQWGYSETGFAAMVLEYVFGLRDKADFEENHPELFT